jgi:cytochrome c oxidase assembly protein subunit 15
MQWCIVAVFAAVMVGGITRLTDSGLSITEWKPVAGVIPPWNEHLWQRAFRAFKEIPQSQTVHAGITLSEFKWIYWWEWFHRMMARGVGLIFAIPYLWLLARGMIPRGLRLRLALLPLLTLAQGVLGWYMVQSGLAERTSVSAYRLTAHLALALAILVVATWTWADLKGIPASARGSGVALADTTRKRWRGHMLGIFALVALTIASGGFVAGLDAGRIFNTFPLMEGEIIPVGYAAIEPWWRNAFENPIAAQFHHRILALTTALFAILAALRVGDTTTSMAIGTHAVRAVQDVGKAALLQATLGVATLLLAVPVWAGVLHQFVGVMVLGAATIALHATRAPGRSA